MYASKVRKFTQATETSLPNHPQMFSLEKINFIRQMVFDEMDELMSAKNVDEQADALVDAIYYLLDSAVRHGINLDPIFDIVHQANMNKIVNGKVLRREDGKILKPPGWQDPGVLLNKEIDRQKQKGAFG